MMVLLIIATGRPIHIEIQVQMYSKANTLLFCYIYLTLAARSFDDLWNHMNELFAQVA